MPLTEAQYNTFMARADALLAWPEALKTRSDQTNQSIINTWKARYDSMIVTSYVDPVAGLDTNDGLTPAAAFKTIQKAVDVTPMGGIGWVNLMGAVTLTTDITVHNRWIMVAGYQSINKDVFFDRYTQVIGGTTYRKVRSFKTRGNASIVLQRLNIKMPMLEAPYTGLPTDGTAFLAGPDFGWFGNHTVSFAYCDVQRPANCFASLAPGVPGGMPMSLGIYGLTATDQPLAGYYCDGVAANTAVSSLSWLRCNYSTI